MTREPWKEPAYFVDRLNWSKGEEWYRRLFDQAGDAAYRGESSTDYTKFPFYQGVADRIARFVPGRVFSISCAIPSSGPSATIGGKCNGRPKAAIC